MPAVKVKENEPFDVALRRFKRSCEKAGVLAEVRSREFYEKPTAERKRKAAAAVKRHAKKVQREQRRSVRLYGSSTADVASNPASAGFCIACRLRFASRRKAGVFSFPAHALSVI